MKRPAESFIALVGAFFVSALLTMVSFSPASAEEMDALNQRWAELTKSHLTFESEHFLIRYPPGKDALLMPLAAQTLERSRTAMEKHLDWRPPERVVVEIYETPRELSWATTLPIEAIETTGTVAVSKFNKIMMVSPKALVRGYSWRETLAHEYVHLVVTQLSGDKVPVWVHEGLAKFFESAWRSQPGDGGLSPASAAFLIEEAKKQALIPFEKMHPSLALLPTPEDATLAYAEAFTAIEHLVAKAGPESLKALVDAYGAGKDDSGAFRAAAQMPFKAFVVSWKDSLKKRIPPKEALVTESERRRFSREGTGENSVASGDEEKAPEKLHISDFPELKNSEAKRRAHLGELLRLRGRHRAAVEEFQQAHALVGGASANLSNRYALALLGAADDVEKAAPRKATKKSAKNFRIAALKILQESRKLFPANALTLKQLGLLEEKAGRAWEAHELYLEAIGIDPFDPDLHRALSQICSKALEDEACASREDLALRVLSGELTAWPAEKASSPTSSL